jgi:hypothetical protein
MDPGRHAVIQYRLRLETCYTPTNFQGKVGTENTANLRLKSALSSAVQVAAGTDLAMERKTAAVLKGMPQQLKCTPLSDPAVTSLRALITNELYILRTRSGSDVDTMSQEMRNPPFLDSEILMEILMLTARSLLLLRLDAYFASGLLAFVAAFPSGVTIDRHILEKCHIFNDSEITNETFTLLRNTSENQ